MKNFSNSANYKNAQTYSGGSTQLPVGGYKCKVIGAKEASFDWGSRLEIAFDVIAGEHKDFYKKQFDANTSEDKKWKGVLRLNIPKDDGTEQDAWTMSKFMTTMQNFEDSNDGYVWNWDESTLKGKLIGIIIRKHYTVIEGKDVGFSEAFRTITIKNIEDGNFAAPADFYDKKWKDAHGNTTADQAGKSDDEFMRIDTSTTQEKIPF